MPPPVKPRPDFWTPEWVIEQFRSGRRTHVLTAEVAAEHEISAASLNRDIRKWRDIPEFNVEYRKLHDHRMRSGRPTAFNAPDKQRLLDSMRNNGGNFRKAIVETGIRPGHVISAMDPRSPRYDPEFVDQFNVAEGERHMELYEAYWDEAITEKDPRAPRRNGLVLTRLGESRLSHVLSPKAQLEISGTVEHRHKIELPASVTHALAESRQALLTREKPLLELPGEVIEAEAVEVGG